MNEIAETAEFGTGTLYKYFKSKEELYFTFINGKTEEINDGVKTELSRKAPAKECVERVLRLQLEFMERNRDFFRIYIPDQDRFEWTVKDDLGKDIHDKRVGYIRLLAQVINQGIKEGEFRAIDPTDLAHSLVGIINSFVYEWLISPHPCPLVGKVDTVLDIFCRGAQRMERRSAGQWKKGDFLDCS